MVVRNWVTEFEKVVYTSPDSKKYILHDPSKKAVLAMAGWGIPSPVIASTSGPFQHGNSPTSIRMPHRELMLLFRYEGCSREEVLSQRATLVNILRVSRTNLNNPVPGNLTWYRADGSIRQVDVFLFNGPKFASTQQWDEFAIHDELTFLANDPTVYNPNIHEEISDVFDCVAIEQLTFPITFSPGTSITFENENCTIEDNFSITYAGGWEEFPVIEIIGPAINPIIEHVDLGAIIQLTAYEVVAGETVTIDLRYGKKTIVSSINGSIIDYLSASSNIGDFYLAPDPIVPNGVNNIDITLTSGTVATQVIFNYYDRYIGV